MMLEVYEERMKAILQFHFMGEALRVLAQRHAIKEKETIKSWNDLNMKRKKTVSLRSTFQYGQVSLKPKSAFSGVNLKLSSLVEENFRKLVHLIKNARI